MSSLTTLRAGVAPATLARGPVTNLPGPLTPVPSISAVPGRTLARIIAGLAMILGVAHFWVLATFPHGVPLTLVLAAMAVACLKCAYCAWNNPRALLDLLAMSALMAITHTFMAVGFGGHSHGGAEPAVAASSAAGAMLAITVAELALVMLCSIGMRRSRFAGQDTLYCV